MDIKTYYESNPAYEFLVASSNLIAASAVPEVIAKYDPASAEDKGQEHKRLHDFRSYISSSLDDFNFLIVRCTIALELALKGLCLRNSLNIFKVDNKNSSVLRNYKELEYSGDIDELRTYPLGVYIEKIRFLLGKNNSNRYYYMFKFFQERRNAYVHFAHRRNTYNPYQIIEYFKLLQEFREQIIEPLREEHSQIEANK